jgi:surfeit locus 1 family protein
MPGPVFENATTPPSRRFRPRALPTIAAAGAVLLFGAAAHWQYGRMLQKEGLRAALDAASASAPVALPVDVPDWASWRYRPVVLVGAFDADRQILIDNKVHHGQVGYHVVTPLRLPDGRAVLVDRGFAPGAADRKTLPAAPPPAGPVTVRGRIALVPEYYLELKPSPPVGRVWQNLDPRRFAEATGVAVLPIVIEQTAPVDNADTLARDWPPPDLGVEKHRIYMVQWLTFAVLALGLWLYFNLRPARRRRDG